MSEPPPDKKDTGTGSTDRTDNHPSVRSVTAGAVSLTVAAVAIVGFAVLGPLGLLAAGAVTVTGGVVAAKTRANLKNPGQRRRAGGRPGLLATLAGRPRRTRSVRTWTKTWPLTGSQSARGRKSRAGGGSGAAGGSRRRSARAALAGLKAPHLPALTKKGRAKRAAAHLATGSHGRGATKAAAPRAAVRPGAKPTGARAPRTPSRTPARAGSARKLTAPPGRTKAAGGATPGSRMRAATRRSGGTGGPGTLRTASRRGNGAQSRRTGRTGLPRVGGGTGTSGARKRTGVRPSTAARPVRRHNRLGGAAPRIKSGTGTRRSTGRSGLPTRPTSRRHPLPRNRPVGTPGTWPRRGGAKATTRARRMATPPTKRRDHRRPGPAAPNRHPHARQPFNRQPTRRLVRTALRVPRRNGRKISRPTKVQSRRARSHLSKRSKVAAGRGMRFAVKSPFLLARASYRHRPLWVWPTWPKPVNPDWLRPTEEAKLKPQKDPRPKRPDTVPVPPSDPPTLRRRHRNPYPKVNARRAPNGGQQPVTQPSRGGTTTMSGPAEVLSDAFTSIANYTPQTPEDLEQFLLGAAEIVQQFGSAFQTLGQRFTSEMPIAQPVAANMQELGVALGACHGIAGQVHSTYVAAHQVEKERRESPRPNEGFWDVGNR